MRQRYIDWTHEEAFSPESLDFILYKGGFSEINNGEAVHLRFWVLAVMSGE